MGLQSFNAALLLCYIVLSNMKFFLLQFPFSLTSFYFCLGCRYVRILGAFYLRLTGTDVDVYRYLEPLYNDYRKLRQKLSEGRKIINISLESAMISFSLLLSASLCCYFHMPSL
jgi:hypothetical protein